MKNVLSFTFYGLKQMVRGGVAYYLWLAFLAAVIAIGIAGYYEQFIEGHIVAI